MPEKFLIDKPNLSSIDGTRVMHRLNSQEHIAAVEQTMSPMYLPWDKVRYRPLPLGSTPEEFWSLVKLVRRIQQRSTVIKDAGSGAFFSWVPLDRFNRFLHEVDMRAGGNLFIQEDRLLELNRHADSYVARGIVEEAIASSQLEGAHTTHKAAVQMIRENRKPHNKDEQMILNNYRVIQQIRDTYCNEKMTRELMLAMHRLLTDKTEVAPEQVGRFRRDADDIVVSNLEHIGHIPPPAAFLLPELDRFIAFANDELEDGAFLHPIIKAILLHFWVGYLHPFADGNGRFARAIFYWYLLRKGYWAMMYLPISVLIKKSPARYSRAYIYSEQDDLDLTYFVDYQVDIIMHAIADFNRYVESKYQQNKHINEKLGKDASLNDRQKLLLLFLSRHPEEQITIGNYQAHNSISTLTARNDLYGLHEKGFLELNKMSDHFVYFTASQKTLGLGL